MKPRSLAALLAASLLSALPRATAAPPKEPEVPPGHSMHGEAFNDGPRQKAYLMSGTGKVHFPITTAVPEAQAFFTQGVGQLHGFWYFESERSFRQAAKLDPACPMTYWGMAMANVNNRNRAKGFIEQAVRRKANAGRRETLWIDAYAKYFRDARDDRARRRELVRDLEALSYEFPHDLEAKAFLAFQIWDNSARGWPLSSHQAFDALLQDIFNAEPMHPVHHYRIHLWDGEKPARALRSAALCGQSSPNIAHMWHMPGHTYSKVHRYDDACWQQEASARVDHRHMMHDHILPDQIHNYTHNNQWLVENLGYVGRVHDAIELAKNLVELPRHPRYNTLSLKADGTPYERSHGSSGEGRRRLFEVLLNYELWDELIALADTVYLEPTVLPAEQVKRLRALGVAHFSRGDIAQGTRQIRALEAMKQQVVAERRENALKAEAKARQDKLTEANIAKAMSDAFLKGADRMPPLEAALNELNAYAALAPLKLPSPPAAEGNGKAVRGDKEQARKLWEQVKDVPQDRLARIWLELGDKDKAIKLAKEYADRGPKQVLRLANYADVLHRAGKPKEAQEQFKKVRELSAAIDLDMPVMRRLAPIAKELSLPADWRVPRKVADDVGQRPNLADLGPFRWQPTPAADWSLADATGRRLALKDFRGRAVVVIFYLGRGCPHCIEQLEAFEPLASRFAAAGIGLVGVSTDSAEGLKQTVAKSKAPFQFPLVSDAELKVFKAYRAFDDFEGKPLHGTFLIDPDGLVRWQDIGFEPYRDVPFLLAEAKRLLSLPRGRAGTRSAQASGR